MQYMRQNADGSREAVDYETMQKETFLHKVTWPIRSSALSVYRLPVKPGQYVPHEPRLKYGGRGRGDRNPVSGWGGF